MARGLHIDLSFTVVKATTSLMVAHAVLFDGTSIRCGSL
jgi:hypothetical protein